MPPASHQGPRSDRPAAIARLGPHGALTMILVVGALFAALLAFVTGWVYDVGY
jgi:hypothetical protein